MRISPVCGWTTSARTCCSELRETGSELNRLLASSVELAAASFAPHAEGDDVLVSGQTNLMAYSELADLDRLRELFEAFQKKNELLKLMEVCARAPGVRLFIGEESGFTALDGCSVVTATYGAQGRVLGAVGVIGPTRMAYERVIPGGAGDGRIAQRCLESGRDDPITAPGGGVSRA